MWLQALFLLLAAITVKASATKQQCHLLYNDNDRSTPRQGACILTPQSIEGPYYIDKLIERSDITEEEIGIPLDLTFVIRNSKTCELLPNIIVDIWHCNAGGLYSGFLSAGNGWNAGRGIPTDDSRFLRGIQTSNENGEVKFRTIFPGWYVGRAFHIHIKLFFTMESSTAEYTGQLYFDEAVSSDVTTVLPYNSSTVTRVLNNNDQWYNNNEGVQTTLPVTGSVTTGYTSTFLFGIELPDEPEPEPEPTEPTQSTQPTQSTEQPEPTEIPSSASSMFTFHLISWILCLQALLTGKRFL